MKTIKPEQLNVRASYSTTSVFRTLIPTTLLIFAINSAFTAETDKKDISPRIDKGREAITRLQVFLDRAQFAPGKIDGRRGEFTVKALALYHQAHDAKPSASPDKNELKPEDALNVSGLDLAGIDPLFITYTVTESDLEAVGELPDAIPEQAKLKALPYQTAAEAIAERFHTDVDFLNELNPGKTKALKTGDQISVPNVEPFDLTRVKSLKVGNEIRTQAANDVEEDAPGKSKASDSSEISTEVKIDMSTNMLVVHENGKIIAAYPVTVGSKQTESPIGEWKVRGIATMPIFRYDKEMLNKGERSEDFHILPPGPNSPVGVIWIALNKKGIGLHGTSDPDNIGRSSSHGCVRMANWDVVRLAGKVKSGVPVSIR